MKYGAIKGDSIIVDFDYDNATDFQDDIAAFSKDGKWGYIDSQGNVIIPFEYDGDFTYEYEYNTSAPYGTSQIEEKTAYLPSEGFIALNKGNDAGYFDINGKEIIPIGTFSEARPVHDGKAWVKDKTTGLWGVIDIMSISESHAVGEWQDVFRNKLNTLYKYNRFYLKDIDNDSIPEIISIFMGGTPSTLVEIYSYKNNILTKASFSYYEDNEEYFGKNTVIYCGESNTICIYKGNGFNKEYYTLDNGGWSVTKEPENIDETFYLGEVYSIDPDSIDKAISDWEKGIKSNEQENKYTYNWAVEPKIEANDIIVYDLEHEIDYSTKKDYKYSVVKHCAYIEKDNKFGIIDYNGNLFCEPIYNYHGRYFGNNYLWVKNEDGESYSVHSGNEKIGINLQTYGRGDMSEFIYYEPTNQELWVDYSSGMKKFSEYYGNSSTNRNEYYQTDKCFTIAEILNPIFNSKGELDLNWIDEEHKGKYGIANKNGLVVKCEYDNCRHYEDYYYGTHVFSDFCALKKDNKWAYYDNNGKQKTNFIFNDSLKLYASYQNNYEYTVNLPTEGFIAVKTDDGAGYIDTNGNEVIPTGTFAETRPVHDGKAWVKDKATGLWGVIQIEKSEENIEQPPIYIAPETIEEPQGNVTENDLKVLEFKIYDNHAEVVGLKPEYEYDNTIKSIVIPNEISGIPVTRICESAFSKTYVASIDIPKNVVEISEDAFSNFYLNDFTFRNSQIIFNNSWVSFRDTIRGYANSTAHEYALSHNINFVFLDNLTDWKELYRKQLNYLRETEEWGNKVGTSNSNARFYLIDIDNDGIPEVVALPDSDDVNNRLVKIYSFANGSMTEKVFQYTSNKSKNVVIFCKNASNKADGLIKVITYSRTEYYKLENGKWSETGETTTYDGWYYPGETYEYDSESIDKAINDWEEGNRISNAPPTLPKEVEEHIKWINDNPNIFFEPDYAQMFEELSKDKNVNNYADIKGFKNFLDLKWDDVNVDFLDDDIDIMIADMLFNEDYYIGCNEYIESKKEKAILAFLDWGQQENINDFSKLLVSSVDVAKTNKNFEEFLNSLDELKKFIKTGGGENTYHSLINKSWGNFVKALGDIEVWKDYYSSALGTALDVVGCTREMLQSKETLDKNKEYFYELRIYYQLELNYMRFYFDAFYNAFLYQSKMEDDVIIRSKLRTTLDELRIRLYSNDIDFDKWYENAENEIYNDSHNNYIKIIGKALVLFVFSDTPIAVAIAICEFGTSLILFFEENKTNIKELANSRDMALLAMIMENSAAYAAQNLANKLKSEVSNADVSNVDQTIETVKKFEYGLTEYKRMNQVVRYYLNKYYEENYYMELSKIEPMLDKDIDVTSSYKNDLINAVEKELVDNKEKVSKEYKKSKISCCSNTENPSFEKTVASLFEKMLLNPVTSKIDKISQGIDEIANLIKQYVICCPVDINVYKGNELKLSIVDDKVVYDSGDCTFGIMYKDDSTDAIKIIQCPIDYEIKIIGNDNGTMNFYKSYFDTNTLRSSYFAADIPVDKNTVYTESTENETSIKIAIDKDADGITDSYIDVLNTISKMLGDVNNDHVVNENDVTLLLNYLNDSSSYYISDQGKINADVYQPGSGLTSEDTDAIKMYINGDITDLPVQELPTQTTLSTTTTTYKTTTTTMTTKPITTTSTTTSIATFTTKTSSKTVAEIKYGDANCDGSVNAADAILIQQSINEPDKYSLTELGKINGDVFNSGDGITLEDADVIKAYVFNKISALPYNGSTESLKAIMETINRTTTQTTTISITTTTTTINKISTLSGDANCDGKVDETDSDLILNYYKDVSVGRDNNSISQQGLRNSDVNHDGIVDSLDASLVKSIANKNNISSTTSTTVNIITTTTNSKPISSNSIIGDVNNDGIIDARDATEVLTDYARTSTGSESKLSRQIADINNDYVIDARDATLILTYYAKTSVGEKMTIEEYAKSMS